MRIYQSWSDCHNDPQLMHFDWETIMKAYQQVFTKHKLLPTVDNARRINGTSVADLNFMYDKRHIKYIIYGEVTDSLTIIRKDVDIMILLGEDVKAWLMP